MNSTASDSALNNLLALERAFSNPRESEPIKELINVLRLVAHDLTEIRAQLDGVKKDFYAIEEVAEMVGRSSYTVRRWISQKRLNATRVEGTGPRGRLLVPREELDKLIRVGRGAGVPAIAADKD